MIIHIKKRYWYYHENSDSIFTDTRENYRKMLGTSEGSFVHELGPVELGSKEEGERLLDEYANPGTYRFDKYLPPIHLDDLPF